MRRTLAILALAGCPLLIAAPAVASVSGDCTPAFNGVEVDRIDGLGSPLELKADETLVFSGTTPSGTTNARVAIVAGPIEVDSKTVAYGTPSNEFFASIDLDDVSPYAVGLYEIRGTLDGCEATAWLRISGRFPVATLAGLTATGLALGGLTSQLGAIASRRRWARLAAASAGIVTGTGVAVLAQQFGRLQPSYMALGITIFLAALLGFVGASLADPSRRRERRRRALEEAMDDAPPEVVEAAERITRSTREQPAIAPDPVPEGPYWCYVLSEVDVFDLTDHNRTVGKLRPGTWYLAKREVGAWVHVTSTSGLEGWAARHAVHRPG